jgi:TPR repeat protein
MKTFVAAFAALVLSHGAYANDFEETTNKALAAGDAAAVLKALDKQVYRGNIIAAQQLGLMYRDGKVVTQDPAKARKWLKVAAALDGTRIWYKRGLADSQYALAIMLRDGIGGKADPAAAASWFEQAAEQGEVRAQLAVAHLYMKSAGIKQNPARAFVWSSIAAKELTEAAQKEAEQIRDLAQKQLKPKQLEKAEKLIGTWTPKTI